MAILNIPRLSMGIPVWMMSTLTIPNDFESYFMVKSIPPPSTSYSESPSPSNHNSKRNKKWKSKKKKQIQRENSPTTTSHARDISQVTLNHTKNDPPTTASHDVGKQSTIVSDAEGIDIVEKYRGEKF
jgi:hypothetical protein